MRAAVFALTAQGALTVRRVQAVLPEADVFVSSRCRVSYPEARGFLRLMDHGFLTLYPDSLEKNYCHLRR